MNIVIYIAVMAGVTYLIRMLPLTLFRKKIKSRFLRSFLQYIPYTVLSAMTFPAIFYSTGNVITAAVGTIAALITAFFGLPLIVVAVAAAGAALAAGLFI
ncbi:MAG: AzlD domain-containing protein [Oscillospiraceae bacterium]|nr:AzlD domain-containing protein [Oscillospiraceae bacterium]